MVATCERLSVHRADEAAALARSVGWPDVAADWRVVFAAGQVFGVIDQAGQLEAVGALCDFGEVSFVAKMIVRPDRQRRGLGGLILRHCLTARTRGSLPALCATTAGQPLYELHGFRPIGRIHILKGSLKAPVSQGETAKVRDSELDEVIAFDRVATGCDRTSMLRARRSESFATASLRDENGGLLGFAFAVNQGALAMVGPVLARDASTATALVLAVAPRDRETRIDVDDAHLAWRTSLESVGFSKVGERTQMTLEGHPLPGVRAHVHAIATQAFG